MATSAKKTKQSEKETKKRKKNISSKGKAGKPNGTGIPESVIRENRYEIMFVLVTVLSVLLVFSLFGAAGPVGKLLNKVSFGMFGGGAYLFPLLLEFGTLFYIANRKSPSVVRKIWASFALFINFNAFLQLITYGKSAEIEYADIFGVCAKAKNGGGLLGGVAAKVLASSLALAGAWVVLLATFLILLILITNKLITNALRRRASEAESVIRQSAERHIEISRQRADEKAERRRIEREQRIVREEQRRVEEVRKVEEARKKELLELEKEKQVLLNKNADLQEIKLVQTVGSSSPDMVEIQKVRTKAVLPPVFPKCETEAEKIDSESFDFIKRALDKKFGSKQYEESKAVAEIQQKNEEGRENFNEEDNTAFGERTKYVSEPSYEVYEGRKEDTEGKEEEISQGEEEIAPEKSSTYIEDDTLPSRTFTLHEVSDEDTHSEEDSSEEKEEVFIKEEEGEDKDGEELREEDSLEGPFEEATEGSFENEEEEEEEELTDEERRKLAILEANTIEGHTVPHSFTREGMTHGELSDRRIENAAKKEESAETAGNKSVSQSQAKQVAPADKKDEEKQEEKRKILPYTFPTYDLLKKPEASREADINELAATARKLEETLKSFGVSVKVTDASCGPAVTRYELHPEQGVKVSKITALADDIKLNLAAADIRIEAPIPGKAAVGIEVPNKENSIVYFRELIEDRKFKESKSKVAFGVGKDIAGQVTITDIAKMPHLLIAGATGSGKSVCINTLIMSILYKARPDEVRFIMIDPKVVELSVYNGIPHLLLPVVTDPKKASGALAWAVSEMNRRYKEFADQHVRDIKSYNKRVGEDSVNWMPQIVIIVDELADLMMVSGKEVEESICRLAQLARAAGIHLVIATQRPSVNVITGLIKANVPSRIAFQVSSNVDSRTILDGAGAEKLLGKGDMLFAPASLPKPIRVQGAFISDSEVGAVVDFIREHNSPAEEGNVEAEVELAAQSSDTEDKETAAKETNNGPDDGFDEYFDEAGKFIIEKKKASIGLLQRAYRIGFNRAARIMDQLAESGVVSEEDGTKPRTILMTLDEFAEVVAARHGGSKEE